MGDRPTDPRALLTYVGGRATFKLADREVEQALRLLSAPLETTHQLPFFAPLFGFTSAYHRRYVATYLVKTSLLIKRVVTPDEADLLVITPSAYLTGCAWASPMTLLAAGYMANRRHATFRFPFYTPKPASFDPWCFPTRRTALLTGLAAVRAWHGLRFGAYGILCHYAVGWPVKLLAVIGYSSTAAKQKPALVGLLRDIQPLLRESLGQTRGPGKSESKGAVSRPPSTQTKSQRVEQPEQQEHPEQQAQPGQQQQHAGEQRQQQEKADSMAQAQEGWDAMLERERRGGGGEGGDSGSGKRG